MPVRHCNHTNNHPQHTYKQKSDNSLKNSSDLFQPHKNSRPSQKKSITWQRHTQNSKCQIKKARSRIASFEIKWQYWYGKEEALTRRTRRISPRRLHQIECTNRKHYKHKRLPRSNFCRLPGTKICVLVKKIKPRRHTRVAVADNNKQGG